MSVTASVIRWVVFVFCLVLVWAGLTPLLRPDSAASTSQATAYAWFHLGSAAVGLFLSLLYDGRGAGGFALVFGLIDLYQAVASTQGWFPQEYFKWTPTDDVVHWVLGGVLVIIGVMSLFAKK